VLKPGGLIIFETPNPENIQVGACNFYFDPTHRNPLPAQTVKFLAESRGFTSVSIHFLHPLDKEHQIEDDGSEVVRRFNRLFYGPRDYAVVGYKA
jgi:O-antigen chain-terminating methyltransferase